MSSLPQHDAPHGMEEYDLTRYGYLGALSEEQQDRLNAYKITTRQENEMYLRQHPEVECMISGFLRRVLIVRPDNVREFAASHFTDSNLATEIRNQLEVRHQKLLQNKYLRML